METKLYHFYNYQEYIDNQKYAARRTTHITKRNTKKRERIKEVIEQLQLKINSVLCVGARHKSEIDFFKNLGYQTTGIDLFGSQDILECDMSKMLDHPLLQAQMFGSVVSIDSIEHCLNLEGFKKGLDRLCGRYFICRTRFREDPSRWDVAVHPFIRRKNFTEGLAYCFPHFEAIYASQDEPGGEFLFILKKRSRFILI